MAVAKFDLQVLEQLCDLLGATNEGFSGSEIGRLLSKCNIDDPEPGNTKRHRLYAALAQKQESDSCGNHIISFLQESMNPVRYVEAHDFYEKRRSQLNKLLAFSGMELGEDGKIRTTSKVTTISEASQRASKLRRNLVERKVHSDVLEYCKAELLVENYFHAVFEATKSVAEKIRKLSGATSDGSELVDFAFSFRNKLPVLALNSLATESEQSEQSGFINLLKGLFGMFRNTTAHIPKIKWVILEQDALDILSMISLIHRRLDAAITVPKAVGQ